MKNLFAKSSRRSEAQKKWENTKLLLENVNVLLVNIVSKVLMGGKK